MCDSDDENDDIDDDIGVLLVKIIDIKGEFSRTGILTMMI